MIATFPADFQIAGKYSSPLPPEKFPCPWPGRVFARDEKILVFVPFRRRFSQVVSLLIFSSCPPDLARVRNPVSEFKVIGDNQVVERLPVAVELIFVRLAVQIRADIFRFNVSDGNFTARDNVIGRATSNAFRFVGYSCAPR